MPTPTAVTINGDLVPSDGARLVRFKIPTPIRYGAGPDVVLPSELTASVEADGTFTIQVYGSNDPAWSPTNWTYQVTVEGDNLNYSFYAQVPYDAGTLDFSDLLPALSASDGSLYAAYNDERITNAVQRTGDTMTGSLTVATGGTSINAVDRGGTSNFAAYVLRTAEVDRWSFQMINNATNDLFVTDSANGNTAVLVEQRPTAPNLSLLTSNKYYGNGVGVIHLPNAAVVPDANPTTGIILYIQDGVLKYRDEDGTVVTAGGGGTGNVLGPDDSTSNALARYATVDGTEIKDSSVTLSDDGDLTGIRRVVRTFNADPAVPGVQRTDINYTPTTSTADMEQIRVSNTTVCWRNEIGFLRGTPHTGYKDDALVRGVARADLTNQTGGFVELQNNARTQVFYKRDWFGKLYRGDGTAAAVAMADVLVLAAAAAVPAGTPAGTVIVRLP